jgi:hypothetical protein
MPRIPDTDIDRIKRQTDLLALVRSRGVELKKHGTKDWIGRCPFHGDQGNPNFIVSPDKGLFHCLWLAPHRALPPGIVRPQHRATHRARATG